jgi:hypothetical protein
MVRRDAIWSRDHSYRSVKKPMTSMDCKISVLSFSRDDTVRLFVYADATA